MVKTVSARTSHLYRCLMDLPGEEGKHQAAGALKESTLTQPCLFGRGNETRGLCLCQLSINTLVKPKPNSSLSGLLAPCSELHTPQAYPRQPSHVSTGQKKSMGRQPPASWKGQACGLLCSMIWEYQPLPLGELKTVELCWS